MGYYPPLRRRLPGEPLAYRLHAYHATLVDRLPSILEHGLVPGFEDPAGQDWKGRYSGRAIYYHLMYPGHEIDNSADWDEGLVWSGVIELVFTAAANRIAPDEEAGTPDMTPEIIRDKGPVVIAADIPPSKIRTIYLPDVPEAEEIADTLDVPVVLVGRGE